LSFFVKSAKESFRVREEEKGLGLIESEWSYEIEWFEESNVCRRIKEYLEKKGYWIMKFNIDKRAKGHDIIAVKDSKKLIVEVKGYPSDKYVRGKKKGQKKPTSPKLQAKHWFAEALLSLIIAKSQSPEVDIALGLLDFEKYRELLDKIRYFRRKFGLICYLVDKYGNVKEIT